MRTLSRAVCAAFILASCLLISGCGIFRFGTGEPASPDENGVVTVTTNLAFHVINSPSPNYDRRTLPVSLIVLHYTGAHFRESLNALTNAKGKNRVSSHYLVDESGMVYRLVDEAHRAWHAGVSRWNGITDVNSASVGIEIVNRGPRAGGGFHPYPSRQIEAVTRLCLDIQSRHDIKDVVGHEDVAPVRKIDPGPLFPWKTLRDRGVKVGRRPTT